MVVLGGVMLGGMPAWAKGGRYVTLELKGYGIFCSTVARGQGRMVENVKGIKRVRIRYRKGKAGDVKITYDSTKTSEEIVMAALSQVGVVVSEMENGNESLGVVSADAMEALEGEIVGITGMVGDDDNEGASQEEPEEGGRVIDAKESKGGFTVPVMHMICSGGVGHAKALLGGIPEILSFRARKGPDRYLGFGKIEVKYDPTAISEEDLKQKLADLGLNHEDQKQRLRDLDDDERKVTGIQSGGRAK